ncbi:Beta-glucuronosyltransferase GlcAT14B [Gracilariopsis chorda]|uniref:Beta-glucuronosyltransferase GlcAT14B n=1 Tax=Gracilariopsis chorda TaxID=448386 RepID=A0A2V3IGX5_9FLOR|nr:Beta-glucuronosyltransferase GlcAT14B [Gracilariopsis chorda]|eukprot:PXF41345.1 Beta-glucuronosyltransferase GlcAT14B [Gracilariopsis chorda]
MKGSLRPSVVLFNAMFLFALCVQARVPTFSYIGEPSHSPVSADNFTPHWQAKRWTLENVTRLSDATDEATIAYFIQISESSLPLTPRLLSRIHHPGNFYALHFDKKIPAHRVVALVSQIKNEPRYSNVLVMPREPVTYRGITMVLNNMAAISHLLERGHWDYFINLSGSDYPLVAPEVPRKILAMPHVRERASNFFIVSPKEQWNRTKEYRLERIAVDTALGMSEKPQDSELVILDQTTPLFSKLNYEFVKGEGWLILTREACKFMISSPYARKMLLSMAFSQDASEHFYVSLFWNNPDFNKTIVSHSLRTVYWEVNGKPSGQHPYTIDKLRESDGSYALWDRLRTSPHWFARKFSVPDNEVMDWIDNQMSGLGLDVDEGAVDESTKRMEAHLHWLYGMM